MPGVPALLLGESRSGAGGWQRSAPTLHSMSSRIFLLGPLNMPCIHNTRPERERSRVRGRERGRDRMRESGGCVWSKT